MVRFPSVWSGDVALSGVFLLFQLHVSVKNIRQIKLQAAWEAQFLNVLDIEDPVIDGLDAVRPQAAVPLPPDSPGVERFVVIAGEDEEIRLTHWVYKELVIISPDQLCQSSLQYTEVFRSLLQTLLDRFPDVCCHQGWVSVLLLNTDQIHLLGLKARLEVRVVWRALR